MHGVLVGEGRDGVLHGGERVGDGFTHQIGSGGEDLPELDESGAEGEQRGGNDGAVEVRAVRGGETSSRELAQDLGGAEG